jgi:hypothetical protein
MKKFTLVLAWLSALTLLVSAADARPPRSSPVEWANFQRQASESRFVEGMHIRLAATQRLQKVVAQTAVPKPAAGTAAAVVGSTPPASSASTGQVVVLRVLDPHGQPVATPRVSKELVKHLYAPLAEGRVRVSYDRATGALWVREGGQALGFPLRIEDSSNTLQLDIASAGLRAAMLVDAWTLPTHAVLDSKKRSVSFYGADGELIDSFGLTEQKTNPVVGPKITRRVRSYELARSEPANAPVARAKRT